MLVVDSHCFLGKSAYGESLTARKFLQIMDTNAVSRSVVFPFTPPDLHFARANSSLAKTVRTRRKRLIGLARADPRLGRTPIRELRSILRRGLAGIMLHPFEQAFKIDSDLARPICELCERMRIPIVIAAGYPIVSTPLQVGDVADQYKSLKLVLGYGAQLRVDGLGQFDAMSVMKAHRNLYMLTTGIPEVGKDGFIEHLVREVGSERVLFGSSAPLMDQRIELVRVKMSNLTENDLERILGLNAEKLFQS